MGGGKQASSSTGFSFSLLNWEKIKCLGPGLALSIVIAISSAFIAGAHGGPTMLYALLIGMAFNSLADTNACQAGIRFSAKTVLRVGVALLGARIALSDIVELGWPIVLLVTGGIMITLVIGSLIGRSFGLKADHAVLSAGAVAICGASAALAIASVLPKSKDLERNTLITIVGVTGLSTVAMIGYPLISELLAFSDKEAGIFLGATIHDVAQVVGAGYMISPEAGETATIVKLMRVAFLAPVVLLIGLFFRSRHGEDGNAKVAWLPTFMIIFLVFVALNSAALIPVSWQNVLNDTSRWALLIAVSALGVKTSLKEIMAPGKGPLATLALVTALLAAFVVLILGLA